MGALLSRVLCRAATCIHRAHSVPPIAGHATARHCSALPGLMSLSTHPTHVSMNHNTYTDGDDDEVDQLDSDLDGEDQLQGHSSSASTSRNRRSTGERVPGYTLIAETRVENILQADGAFRLWVS